MPPNPPGGEGTTGTCKAPGPPGGPTRAQLEGRPSPAGEREETQQGTGGPASPPTAARGHGY
eukprot:8424326-Alexandrium_andersonii.AAC.1